MVRFMDDYDEFEAGETLYSTQEEEIYVEVEENGEMVEKLINFPEETEIEVKSIDRSEGYGRAELLMGGYKTRLYLDELFSITRD